MRGRRLSPLASLALWAVVALLVCLDAETRGGAAPVMGAFIGGIVAGLAAVFGWLADKAATVAIVVWHAVKAAGFLIWDLGRAVGKVFIKAWDFLGLFWRNVLKPFVSWAWKEIRRLHGWLERTFGPTLRLLNSIRTHILQLYEKWLRPIFDTITVTRRLLQVLATFHVGFAEALDRKLAQLEDKLLQPIYLALRTINQVIDVVNRIVDFNGLFQRLTLVASMLEYERDMWRVWWTSVARRQAERPKLGPPAPGEEITIAQAARDYRAHVLLGGGRDSTRINEHAADYAIRLRSVHAF